MIQELADAGIPDSKIRFIAATGTHAPMDRAGFVKKLGEATLSRFPVYNHNPFDNCVYVGTTSYGTRVSINSEVMKCDFKIAIGAITPHLKTVFSGGAKMILPGVASIETIMANHKLPCREREKVYYEENPLHRDMEEAANLTGLDASVNCMINLWGDTVAIFAGALGPAQQRAVAEAKTHYLTPRAVDKDIVIANTYTEVNEAAKGAMLTFSSVSKQGGDMVLICHAPEGQIVHYLMGSWGKTTGGRMRSQIPLPPHINHLIVYSAYPDLAGLGYFQSSDKIQPISTWAEVLKFLRPFHQGKTKVAIYPHADILYCAPSSQ